VGIKKWQYIEFSAILLNVSLIFPKILYFLGFIFLIPIFYIALKEHVAFKEGFLWGVIFFSIHFFGYIFLFKNEANGYLSVLIPIGLALYCALYAGLWFFFASCTVSFFEMFFAHKNTIIIVLAWSLWTYLYFAWVRYGIFWIFGEFVGYPFCSPLLPLVCDSRSLYFLGLFGKSFSLVLVILISMVLAHFLVKKKYITISIFLILFLASNFLSKTISIPCAIQQKKDTFNYSSYIGHLNPIRSQKYSYPLDAAQEIFYNMVDLFEKKPDTKIIVMPESSFLFPLNKHIDLIDIWYSNILEEKISLLIGAPYKEKGDLFNALYWIQGGKIRQVYKKTKLMVFAEYIPRFWQKNSYLRHLFFASESFFTHGKKGRIIFDLCQNIKLKPLICSDFFLGKRKEAKLLANKGFSAAVVLVNDHIFPMGYLKNLMFLYAKLESINRRKDILYVGYYFAAWISKDGSVSLIG